MAYALAALGGALGAVARWGVSTALPSDAGAWPWATLAVNLVGCLLIGALLAALAVHRPEATWPRPLLGAGVLGGFTTFSTFAVEVVQAVGAGSFLFAASYVLVSLAGGVLAVLAGATAVRALVGGPGP